MSRTRRNPGWVTSGDVSDFLPIEQVTEEHGEEYWDGTLEHLESLSRIAASRAWSSGTFPGDKREAALSGITMALAEDLDTPISELLNRGQDAVSKALQTHLQQHGKRTDHGTGGRFAAFWEGQRQHFDNYGFTREALHQVWRDLEEKHQQALLGRVAYGDHTEHGKSIGLGKAAATKRVMRARRAALALWFDWETPPTLTPDVRRHDITHCTNGHSFDEHGGWVTRKGRGRSRYCKACSRITNRKK